MYLLFSNLLVFKRLFTLILLNLFIKKMNIDNIGGKYVRDQAFLEPISNGYNDIEGNVTYKKKSVRKA